MVVTGDVETVMSKLQIMQHLQINFNPSAMGKDIYIVKQVVKGLLRIRYETF